jgi:hypothetical protein
MSDPGTSYRTSDEVVRFILSYSVLLHLVFLSLILTF